MYCQFFVISFVCVCVYQVVANILLTSFQSENSGVATSIKSVHKHKRAHKCENNCVIKLKNDAHRYSRYHGECDNQRHADVSNGILFIAKT